MPSPNTSIAAITSTTTITISTPPSGSREPPPEDNQLPDLAPAPTTTQEIEPTTSSTQRVKLVFPEAKNQDATPDDFSSDDDFNDEDALALATQYKYRNPLDMTGYLDDADESPEQEEHHDRSRAPSHGRSHSPQRQPSRPSHRHTDDAAQDTESPQLGHFHYQKRRPTAHARRARHVPRDPSEPLLEDSSNPRPTPVKTTTKRPFIIPLPPRRAEPLKFYNAIRNFYEDDNRQVISFSAALTRTQRKMVRNIAAQFMLKFSTKQPPEVPSPVIQVSKIAYEEAERMLSLSIYLSYSSIPTNISIYKIEKLHELELLEQILNEHTEAIRRADAESDDDETDTEGSDQQQQPTQPPTQPPSQSTTLLHEAPPDPSPTITDITTSLKSSPALTLASVSSFTLQPTRRPCPRGKVRFMNWNIEWMSHFFSYEGVALLQENPDCGLSDIPALCTLIGQAIMELNPDLLAIEEGPAHIEQMQLFVSRFLQDRYTCITYVLYSLNTFILFSSFD